jgi:hypothetical protein
VTDAGVEHLKELTQLQWLDLSDTQVTDAGVENLEGLTHKWSVAFPNSIQLDMTLACQEKTMPWRGTQVLLTKLLTNC